MYFGIYFSARLHRSLLSAIAVQLCASLFIMRRIPRRGLPVILKFKSFSVCFENDSAELVRSDIRYVKLGKQRESFGMRVPVAVVFAAGYHSPLRVHRLKKILRG